MTDNSKKPEQAKSAKDTKADGDKDKEEKGGAALTESDILMFKRYGKGPYTDQIKKVEDDIKDFNQKISTLCGIKESDTGLALPA